MKFQDDNTETTMAMYGLRSCKGKMSWSCMTHRRHGLTLESRCTEHQGLNAACRRTLLWAA